MTWIRSTKPLFAADNLAFILLESVLILVAVFLAYMVRFPQVPGEFSFRVVLCMGAVVIVVQTILYYNGMYEKKAFTAVEAAVKVIVSLAIASGVLTIAYFALPAIKMGRGVFALSFGFCTVFLIISRLLQIYLYDRDLLSQRIIILGTGHRAMEVARLISQKKGSGYTLLGLIASDEEWMARKDRLTPEGVSTLTLVTGAEEFSEPVTQKSWREGAERDVGRSEAKTEGQSLKLKTGTFDYRRQALFAPMSPNFRKPDRR